MEMPKISKENKAIPSVESVAAAEIDELRKIKENMVPKSELEKVQAEKERYRSALIKGIELKDDVKPRSLDDLRKTYAENIKKGVTQLEGFKTALELREAAINETGADPFMSEALHKIDPSFGERVSSQLRELIDGSDNNPSIFTARLSASLR